MLDTFLEMIGLYTPLKKNTKKRNKGRQKHRTHADYMNSYSYKMDKKARKETSKAYGEVSSDIFTRNN